MTVLHALVAPPAVPPQTLADLHAWLADWPPGAAARRRCFASHIRTAALIAQTGTLRARGRLDRLRRADSATAAVPCDIAWLNAHLFRATPRTYGLSQTGFANVISALRTLLRAAGVSPPPPPPPPPASAWHTLLQAVAAQPGHGIGLIRFAGWCHQQAIPPGAVTSETLGRFEAALSRTTLHRDIPGLIRTVATAWRRAAGRVTQWPDGQIAARPRRQGYTYAFACFPRSFQDEVARFRAAIAQAPQTGPFRAGSLRRPLRPRTQETRLYGLRQAASALAILRGGPASITRLADLVEEAAMRQILRFYWERAIAARVARGEYPSAAEAPVEAGVTAQTGGIAATLMMIARHHCQLPAERLAVLRDLAADLQPPRQASITAGNLERLSQFDDPRTLLDLLNLPETLMRRAEAMRRAALEAGQPYPRAAALAATAAALAVLLHIPLRIGNLAGLRLGQHLKFDASRAGRLLSLVLQRHETKNAQDLQWPITAETAAFLDRYLRRFRPQLAAPGSDWLFPGRGGTGGVSVAGLRGPLVRAVAADVGAVIHPHLFRALAVRLILDDTGALEDARQLLGDKSMAVILAHYASRDPARAAQRYDATLRRAHDTALRRLATPPRTRPAPSRKPRPSRKSGR
jgi:hypothetical protein